MQNIDLKPCPFCGSRTAPRVVSIAELESTTDNEWNNTHYSVVCDKDESGCGASTCYDNPSVDAAAEAWNRRAEDDKR